MKKAIALLATLVVLTSTTFAQLAPTITGYAETKWGTNLDSEQSGFELDSSVTVTVPLFGSETVATEGEGAYGLAEITGSSLTFTLGLGDMDDDDNFLTDDLNDADSVLKGTDADISAKLDFGNGVYATIGSASDITANKVASDDDTYDLAPDFGGEDGISLGYAKDAVAFELTVKNEDNGYVVDNSTDEVDETTTDATDIKKEYGNEDGSDAIPDASSNSTTDAYYMGATASYTADMFALSLALGTTATAGDVADADKKTGVAVEAKVMPTETLTITVPFDYFMKDAGTAMELRPTVDATFGALTAGLNLHYITLAKDLLAAAEDYTNMTLGATLGYTLDAGALAVTLGSNLGDMDSEDMSLDFAATWTADVYTATVDLGNTMDMDNIGIDFGFTGVEGVTVAVETALSLEDKAPADDDYNESFTFDKINVDFDSAITGLENTVITVNYSEFNTGDAKGTFYVGAKISL
ncbi:hypothetical protein EW093_12180 [Thiospirochaeta perfilievii]|uniref:Porin n=1 Tax=Thiospirochaeta perfilievii TaxID=252967 RepID=A0A5C1QDJ9_9SPIO|nr:hypothetical protein [Thiospirochaeta perfilievii]QEN05438.1 hypothetical protein EW093_12180 [Thiospirochaeta perfilievii]